MICPSCGRKYLAKSPKSIECLCGTRFGTDVSTGCAIVRIPSPPPLGVGTEFVGLTNELGLRAKGGCNCQSLKEEMNRLGTEGCRQEKPRLLVALQANAKEYSWLETLAAGAAAVTQGLPLTIEGLLDEAIRRAEAKIFTAPPVRNLVYHVGPFSGNEVWRWNVQQILKRIDLFTGKRAVSIITGDGMDSPDEVKRAFGCAVENFATFPNDPLLREVVSFPWLMEQVASTAQNEITFFGHAKGVTKSSSQPVRRWTEIMYETCLDYMPLSEKWLQACPVLGSFKRVGRKFFGGKSESDWHYSGTFYWLRNSQVFSRPNWQKIDRRWWGTESWPGIHFTVEEGGLLFHENPEMDLYKADYMAKVVAEYGLWKEAVKRG